MKENKHSRTLSTYSNIYFFFILSPTALRRSCLSSFPSPAAGRVSLGTMAQLIHTTPRPSTFSSLLSRVRFRSLIHSIQNNYISCVFSYTLCSLLSRAYPRSKLNISSVFSNALQQGGRGDIRLHISHPLAPE